MTRARGTGHVFRPTWGKAGRTAATWAIAYYDRRRKRTVREYGFATEHAAEKQLRARLSDQDRGVLTGAGIERVTWEDLAKLITDEYAVNKRDTSNRLRCSLARLRETFGLDKAIEVTTDRITAYSRARLDAGAAAATVNRELAALKRSFNLALQARRIGRDTMPYIPMLKEDNARQGFFERPQFLAVRKRLPEHLQPIVTMAFITGWRVPSEVLTRQWRHVDLKAGWLRIEPGEAKNGRGRMFPLDLDPELREMLKVRRALTDELEQRLGRIVPWVFWSGDGVRVGSFYKAWKAALTAAATPGRILHDFRRTAARNLLRAGVPQQTAMMLVGLETDSIFRRYAVVDERMLMEAATMVRLGQSGRSLGTNSERKARKGRNK